MKYIGIDIGFSGAIAVVSKRTIKTIKIPVKYIKKGKKKSKEIDKDKLTQILKQITRYNKQAIMFVIEAAQARYGEHPYSILTFGKEEGIIEMAIHQTGCSYMYVHASAWKSYYNLNGQGKQGSINYVRETYKIQTDDHNIADAILIAKYGKYLNERKEKKDEHTNKRKNRRKT